MKFLLLLLIIFCNVNCQLFDKGVHNSVKCIIGKTSKRSQWKVKTCPPYSSYCVTSEIGNLNVMLSKPIDIHTSLNLFQKIVLNIDTVGVQQEGI